MDVNSARPAPQLQARLTREQLIERFSTIREFSRFLTEPLETEDFVVQARETTSPIKWHLAHVSWFYEKFILEKVIPEYQSPHPQYNHIFNSYYLQAGTPHKRAQRGLLTRPTVEQVFEYREYVNNRIRSFLEETDKERLVEFGPVIEIGNNHEQQHQELILTDLKYLFAQNPLKPSYRELKMVEGTTSQELQWITFEDGVYSIGNRGDEFCYDNEQPRHRTFVEPFQLSNRLITNEEYLEFIKDGGYRRPVLWLDDGWSKVQEQNWKAPLYWQQRDGQWFQFTLGGTKKLNLKEPVTHISYYEADAFARWRGKRLPTEAEWEVAASDLAVRGTFVEAGTFHPQPLHQNSNQLLQMFGDVWEWTQSAYSPYPGYKSPSGALGEYNGKFMCNQFVLRGGSCVTSESHIRKTYRNFFYPDARWQFNGIRLAETIRG